MNHESINEARRTLRDYPLSKDYKLLAQSAELTADPCQQPSALAQLFMWIGVSITALVAVTILFILFSSTYRP